MGKAFLKVDLEVVSALGTDAAILYALLKNTECIWKQRDDHGYCLIWRQYLLDKLGWSRSKLLRVRNDLISYHLLDFVPGKNQNSPGKYKTH